MKPTLPDRAGFRAARTFAIAAASVYLCARLGYAYSIRPAMVVAVWPGGGVLLAMLLLLDNRRAWIPAVLGGLLGNVAGDLQQHLSPVMALAGGAANTTEAVVAAIVVSWLSGQRVNLGNLRQLASLVVGAAVASNAVTALLGATVLSLSTSQRFWDAWFIWWAGDGMGILLFAPLVLTWADVVRSRPQIRIPVVAEGLAIYAGIGLIAFLSISRVHVTDGSFDQDLIALFPLLLYAAARFGPVGASTGVGVLTAVTLSLTSRGTGVFSLSGGAATSELSSIYSYLGFASLSCMLPACIVSERISAQAISARLAAQLTSTLESITDAFYTLDTGWRFTYVNPEAERLMRLPREQLLGRSLWDVFPDAYRSPFKAEFERAVAESVAVEVDAYSESLGTWVEARAYPSPQGLTVYFRDVTSRHRASDQLRALALRLETAHELTSAAIAREVHDELGQSLTVLRMDVTRLAHHVPPDAAFSAIVADMSGVIDETLQRARSIARALHPTALDDLGLAAAIEMHAAHVARRTQLRTVLDLSPVDRELDRTRAGAAYRIFQESMTNIIRHAHATTVSVRLYRSAAQLVLEITDDGIGITVEDMERVGSLGLLSMRERAIAINGTVTIERAHPRGTTVKLELPDDPSSSLREADE